MKVVALLSLGVLAVASSVFSGCGNREVSSESNTSALISQEGYCFRQERLTVGNAFLNGQPVCVYTWREGGCTAGERIALGHQYCNRLGSGQCRREVHSGRCP